MFYGVNVMNTFCNILYCFEISQNLMVYRFSKMYSINTDHSFQNVVVKKWSYKSESLIQFIVKKRQKRKSMAYTAIDSYYVNELLKCAAVVAVQYPRK